MLLEEEERAEAARKAFLLLRPDEGQVTVDRQAFTDLSAGRLSGDRAVSLWTEKWQLYKLEMRLKKEMESV